MRTRNYKAKLEVYEDEYIEAKRQAFLELVISITESYVDSCDMYDFNPSLQELYEDSDIEFEFPEAFDWCHDQIQNELDEIGDAKYEQMRDERMELD